MCVCMYIYVCEYSVHIGCKTKVEPLELEFTVVCELPGLVLRTELWSPAEVSALPSWVISPVLFWI